MSTTVDGSAERPPEAHHGYLSERSVVPPTPWRRSARDGGASSPLG